MPPNQGLQLATGLRLEPVQQIHSPASLHEQGIECHFLEQWHQKLHTNTTPEDITICEAYLAFLHSGHKGDFWQSLWDRGHITRDMLATMDHPITGLLSSIRERRS